MGPGRPSAARTPTGVALIVELAELLQAAVNGGGARVNCPARQPLAGAGSGPADVVLNPGQVARLDAS